jgi:hypothetical protein
MVEKFRREYRFPKYNTNQLLSSGSGCDLQCLCSRHAEQSGWWCSNTKSGWHKWTWASGERRDDVVSASNTREQRTWPTSRWELYDNGKMVRRRIWKDIQNRVHRLIKLIGKICKRAQLSNASSESARGFNSYRIPGLPKHMGLQHVRRTLEHTDLPKDEVWGINVTEHPIDALLINEFLQVVDVGIYRGSNLKWRSIAVDVGLQLFSLCLPEIRK